MQIAGLSSLVLFILVTLVGREWHLSACHAEGPRASIAVFALLAGMRGPRSAFGSTKNRAHTADGFIDAA